MKKLLLLSAFLFPLFAYATSGTCSYHGGVNCSTGSDWDGSAICNDGWRDSSEMFSDTKECKQARHYCTPSEDSQIKAKYNLDEQAQALKVVSDKVLSYKTDSLSYDQLAKQYLEQSTYSQQYYSLNAKYTSDLNSANAECYALGDKEYAKMQADLYVKYSNPDSLCSENETMKNGSCSCKTGYTLSSGKCIDNSLNCMNQYGKSSYYDSGSCQCGSGYKFDSNKSKCVPNSDSGCQANATLVNGSCTCIRGSISDGRNCIPKATYCLVTYGLGLSSDGEKCNCPTSQEFDTVKNICAPIKVVSVSKPIVAQPKLVPIQKDVKSTGSEIKPQQLKEVVTSTTSITQVVEAQPVVNQAAPQERKVETVSPFKRFLSKLKFW